MKKTTNQPKAPTSADAALTSAPHSAPQSTSNPAPHTVKQKPQQKASVNNQISQQDTTSKTAKINKPHRANSVVVVLLVAGIVVCTLLIVALVWWLFTHFTQLSAVQEARYTALAARYEQTQRALAATQLTLTKQTKRLQALEQSTQIQHQVIQRLTNSLALSTPEHAALRKVTRLIVQADTLWSDQYDASGVLTLLKAAYDLLVTHQLETRYTQLSLALTHDIQALTVHSPANKTTLVRQLDVFSERLQATLRDDSFAVAPKTLPQVTHKATKDVTIATPVDFMTRLQALFKGLVEVRNATISDQWWRAPQAISMLRITSDALLLQTRLAVMHNNFYDAQLLLAQLQKKLAIYDSLIPLRQTITVIQKLAQELQLRFDARLQSSDQITYLNSTAATTPDTAHDTPLNTDNETGTQDTTL